MRAEGGGGEKWWLSDLQIPTRKERDVGVGGRRNAHTHTLTHTHTHTHAHTHINAHPIRHASLSVTQKDRFIFLSLLHSLSFFFSNSEVERKEMCALKTIPDSRLWHDGRWKTA